MNKTRELITFKRLKAHKDNSHLSNEIEPLTKK